MSGWYGWDELANEIYDRSQFVVFSVIYGKTMDYPHKLTMEVQLARFIIPASELRELNI